MQGLMFEDQTGKPMNGAAIAKALNGGVGQGKNGTNIIERGLPWNFTRVRRQEKREEKR